MSEIEDIKDKIDIADLIGEYVKLTPAGANFKALCPFHNEKTPSMMVSPDKKIYKCFGCGAAGDIFEFLMKIEGLEFPEAKRVLAKKAGIVLTEYHGQDNSQKTRLLRAIELAKKYYNYVLLNSPPAKPAMDYLVTRGLSEETIIDWEIGYSPDGWNNLSDFLSKKGITEPEMFSAGLTVKKKNGFGFFDRFRSRIMFPINDVNGNTIAFTARVSPEKEAAETMGKYINSPQTEIYDKSRVVFALDKAKAKIKSQDAVIIVEGQMDAITAHQNGFKNVVASSGTALTIHQLERLKKYTANFLFALDADLAGQNAIDKGGVLAQALDLYVVESTDAYGRQRAYVDPEKSHNINIKIVEIKNAKDPDELIRKNPTAWREAVAHAKPIMEYYFNNAILGVNVSDVSEQLKVIRKLLPKINKLNNKIEIDYWLKLLAQKMSVSEDLLREEIIKLKTPPATNKNEPGKVNLESETLPKDWQLVRRIMAIIIKFPEFLKIAGRGLSAEYVYTVAAIDLYKLIMLLYTDSISQKSGISTDNSETDYYESWRNQLKSEKQPNQSLIDLLDESFLLSDKDFFGLSEREALAEIENAIGILKNDYLNSRISSLNRELRAAEEDSDQARIDRLSRELSDLFKQKN